MDRTNTIAWHQQRALKQQLRERAEANETLRDERALQDMPEDIHAWAATPNWDDVELFNSQTCREAP